MCRSIWVGKERERRVVHLQLGIAPYELEGTPIPLCWIKGSSRNDPSFETGVLSGQDPRRGYLPRLVVQPRGLEGGGHCAANFLVRDHIFTQKSEWPIVIITLRRK